MKVKDLINQLSNYNADADAEVELMYSFYTLSSDNDVIRPIINDGNFIVIKQNKVDLILLTTNNSLVD